MGGKSLVAASLHCSKSPGTADLVLELVSVLGRQSADVYMVGLDTNLAGHETSAFENRLKRVLSVDLGREHADQVTLPVMRTSSVITNYIPKLHLA